MKLNEFFKKSTSKRIQRTQSVFNLSNDKKEQELGGVINNLEAQLQQAHINIQRLSPFENKYNTVSSSLQEKEAAINRLQNNVDQQENSLVHLRNKVQDLQEAEKSLKSVTKTLEVSESKLYNSKKELGETNNNFNSLQTALNKMTNEKGDVEANYYELTNDFNTLRSGFTVVEGENGSLQNILLELKEKYTNIIEDNKSLERDCQILFNDNKSARLKIEELDSFKVQLSEWNKKLMSESTQATTKSSALDKNITKRDAIIQDMNTYIETLISDREDLTSLVDYLKHELRKPRYSPSATFLSRKIGMPTSKKNIRTEYLGTGSPTMLKFAVKEEANA